MKTRSTNSPSPRIAVVGAGAFGGWTALHLQRLGARVELIDAWGPGNARSSSGGDTRIIRAIYGADRTYVEIVKRAFELWDEIRLSTDEPLYVETGVLWMHRGDDAYVRSSLPVMESVGFPVEKVEVSDATRRYPQIDFRGIKSAWLEKRAGALAAQRACVAVRDAFEKAGGTYRTASAKAGSLVNGSMTALLVDGLRVEADAYVFACGPWLGRVFPDVVGDRILPTRQEVFYFGVPFTSVFLPVRSATSPPIFRSGSISVRGSSTVFPTSTAADSKSPTTRAVLTRSDQRRPQVERRRTDARTPLSRRALPRAGQCASAVGRSLSVRKQPRRQPDHRPASRRNECLAPRRRLRPRLQTLPCGRRDGRRSDRVGNGDPEDVPSRPARRDDEPIDAVRSREVGIGHLPGRRITTETQRSQRFSLYY